MKTVKSITRFMWAAALLILMLLAGKCAIGQQVNPTPPMACLVQEDGTLKVGIDQERIQLPGQFVLSVYSPTGPNSFKATGKEEELVLECSPVVVNVPAIFERWQLPPGTYWVSLECAGFSSMLLEYEHKG